MTKRFIILSFLIIALLFSLGFFYYYKNKNTNEINSNSSPLKENEIISIFVSQKGGYWGDRTNFEITLVPAKFSKEKYYGAIDKIKFNHFCNLINKINFNSFLGKQYKEGSEHVDFKLELKTWGGNLVIENISKEYPKEFKDFIIEIDKFRLQAIWTKTDEANANLLIDKF